MVELADIAVTIVVAIGIAALVALMIFAHCQDWEQDVKIGAIAMRGRAR